MKALVVVVLAVAFLAFMSVGEPTDDVWTAVAWGVGALVVGWILAHTVLRELAERHDLTGERWAPVGAILGGVVAAFDPGIIFTFAFIGGSVGLILPFVQPDPHQHER